MLALMSKLGKCGSKFGLDSFCNLLESISTPRESALGHAALASLMELGQAIKSQRTLFSGVLQGVFHRFSHPFEVSIFDSPLQKADKSALMELSATVIQKSGSSITDTTKTKLSFSADREHTFTVDFGRPVEISRVSFDFHNTDGFKGQVAAHYWVDEPIMAEVLFLKTNSAKLSGPYVISDVTAFCRYIQVS